MMKNAGLSTYYKISALKYSGKIYIEPVFVCVYTCRTLGESSREGLVFNINLNSFNDGRVSTKQFAQGQLTLR